MPKLVLYEISVCQRLLNIRILIPTFAVKVAPRSDYALESNRIPVLAKSCFSPPGGSQGGQESQELYKYNEGMEPLEFLHKDDEDDDSRATRTPTLTTTMTMATSTAITMTR